MIDQNDVQFDAQHRQNYNLDAQGNRVYHGVPPGFEFSAAGELELAPDATVAQVQGWGVQHPCGPPELAAYHWRLLQAFEHANGMPLAAVPAAPAAVVPPPTAPEPVHIVRVGDGGGGAEQSA